MKTPLQDLWDDVVPLDGPCPAPRPHTVAQRVNAALDAVPSERTRHMKQKIRTAAVLVAAVLALTGSVLAVAGNWTVLDTFFGGSSEAGEALMDDQPRSVSDDQYTLTVTSSVADGSTAYLLLTVEAKTPQAIETLMAEDFVNMDTWSTSSSGQTLSNSNVSVSSVGTREEENLRTETSRTWAMELMMGTTPETVSIRLNVMKEGLWLEVPLTIAQSVTVAVGAEGTGAGTLQHAAGGPLTLDSVTLTPLGLTLEYTQPLSAGASRPTPAFLGTDGTLYSWSQLVSDLSKGGPSEKDAETITMFADYAFREVQDLSLLGAVVFEGTAYPLDGGEPYAVDTSDLPVPFQLPLQERLQEGGAYAVPVRALCEGLGASCVWDNATRSVTMTFRDVTIVLTTGSTYALVNGEAVTLPNAPVIRENRMDADCQLFCDVWSLDLCAAMENRDQGLDQRVAWVVIP